MSTLKELDSFNEHHIERCGRPIQKIAFYAEAVAAALVLADLERLRRLDARLAADLERVLEGADERQGRGGVAAHYE